MSGLVLSSLVMLPLATPNATFGPPPSRGFFHFLQSISPAVAPAARRRDWTCPFSRGLLSRLRGLLFRGLDMRCDTSCSRTPFFGCEVTLSGNFLMLLKITHGCVRNEIKKLYTDFPTWQRPWYDADLSRHSCHAFQWGVWFFVRLVCVTLWLFASMHVYVLADKYYSFSLAQTENTCIVVICTLKVLH